MTTTNKRRTVRLNCEVMECRLVPATVIYEGTETWSGFYGTVTVESKVSEDVSGLAGKRLFEFRVTNDSFEPQAPSPDGVEFFGVPVDDPTVVADVTGPAGWFVDVGYSGVMGGGDAVTWTGNLGLGYFLAVGNSAEFSFTTPVADPFSTDGGGSVFGVGQALGTSGLCAAPVAAMPSVRFTSGPDAIENVSGGVKISYRWDNCNGIAKIRVRVVDDANPGTEYYNSDFATTQASSSRTNQQLLTNAPPGKKVRVIIEVLDAMGGVIVSKPETVTVN